MTRQTTQKMFLESASEWICDSYSFGIHYLAITKQNSFHIVDASLVVTPLPPERIDNFMVKAGNLQAGRQIFPAIKKTELLKRLNDAADGVIHVHGLEITLYNDTELDFYSAIPGRDAGFFELQLTVTGSRLPPMSQTESVVIDNELRLAEPPFDGISDVCSWLQLSDARVSGQAPSISLRVGPPVDIVLNETSVHGNNLRLTLSAHSKFDTSTLKLALREFPGFGIETRLQASHLILWDRSIKGRRTGTLTLKLANANSVLAMLMVSDRTVRRRWFDDPDKAVNSRYVATQLFDKDLKQLKLALLESPDSVKFEKGVASLLYLLGFSSAIQVETQAPDIIVTTPGGKLAILECTVKISDFQNKLGKLVDRRNALMTNLELTGHNLQVGAFLVCGLPRGQIAAEERQLTHHQVTLICREDISRAFDQLRIPSSPDEMLDRAAAQLTDKRSIAA